MKNSYYVNVEVKPSSTSHRLTRLYPNQRGNSRRETGIVNRLFEMQCSFGGKCALLPESEPDVGSTAVGSVVLSLRTVQPEAEVGLGGEVFRVCGNQNGKFWLWAHRSG